MTCYTLLHQVTRAEGKNSLWERRDIFVFVILNGFSFFLNYVLSSFRLYYIQFKEVTFLWGPGAEDRM